MKQGEAPKASLTPMPQHMRQLWVILCSLMIE
jgi:hypothetical protein